MASTAEKDDTSTNSDVHESLAPQDFLKKFYPGGFFGHDRDGRPVFWEPLGQVDFWGILHSIKSDEVMAYKREHCERAKILCEEQEKKLGKKLDKHTTLVLDADGGGRKHLWKPGLDLFKALVQMYDEDFPDLRKRIVVIKTPAIFPILFSLLQPFLKQSTKDKIKVLGKDWQKQLQKYIAPEEMPEFYGGTRKDDAGSGKCEQHICFGGDIPLAYYVNDKVDQEQFQSSVIKAGRKLTIVCEVNVPGSTISYQFVTSDFDIQFSVYREADGSEREIIKKEERKQSHIIMEDGEILCENIGNYVFVFDNRYSWIRDKELFYLIKTDNDDEGETPLTESEAKSDANVDEVTEQMNGLETNN